MVGPATFFCPYGRFPSQVKPKTQTCNVSPPDLRRGAHPSDCGAMIHTFWADYAHFIARHKRRGSIGVQTCSRPRLHEREGPGARAKRGEREGRSERSERRVWAPMLPAARVASGVAARGSELGETKRRRRSGRGRSGAP